MSVIMLVNMGFRYRAYPDAAQFAAVRRAMGCRRFVKNEAKRLRLEAWRNQQKTVTNKDVLGRLAGLKETFPFLREVPHQILFEGLVDSNTAFDRFFKKQAGYPDWSRKYEDESARFPAVRQRQRVFDKDHNPVLDENGEEVWSEHEIISIDRYGIDCPKFGKIRWSMHRPLRGTPKSVTFTLDGGLLFVSVMCEVELKDPDYRVPAGPLPALQWRGAVPGGERAEFTPSFEPDFRLADAFDVGVCRHYADAFGGGFNLPGWTKGEKDRRLRLEREIARKVRFREAREKDLIERKVLKKTERLSRSRRESRQREELAALHGRVRRRNENALHVETTRRTKTHGLIGVEDLKVRAMTASAKGTVEQPGKNVAAKAALNKGLLGASPAKCRRFLDYKGHWYGCLVVPVPAAYTSQYCSHCGRHPKDDPATAELADGRISQAEFVCPLCAFRCNADTNAARNIRYGAMVLAGWVDDPVCLARLKKLGAKTVAERRAEAEMKLAKRAETKVKKQIARTAALARKHEQKRRKIQAEKRRAGSDPHLRGLPLFDAVQSDETCPRISNKPEDIRSQRGEPLSVDRL